MMNVGDLPLLIASIGVFILIGVWIVFTVKFSVNAYYKERLNYWKEVRRLDSREEMYGDPTFYHESYGAKK